MKVLRVKIKGIISSFRNPSLISGVQPTLDVPPPSTIIGLISSICGRILTTDDVKFGYVFFHSGKGADTELIYELSVKSRLKAKSNVIRREFLFKPELYLYIDRIDFEKYFRRPEFPVLLGRSQELAKIESVETIELLMKSPVRLGHTVLPFGFKGVPGPLIAAPIYFRYEPGAERRGVKVQPLVVVREFVNYTDKPVWYDKEKNWGVFMYGSS